MGDRLQDPTFTFWNEQFEAQAGLAEAISELLLIVGRPTQIYNGTVVLTPNTVWQPLPQNVLALTTIRCNGALLWKSTLHSLDYLQASWGSNWQSDRGPLPKRWAPLGLSMFVVHPAPLQPIKVQISAIEYPFLDTWPPDGTETSPFHKEVNQALEMYAAAYCRVKEVGQDHAEGQQLYQRFLAIGRRLTTIETRKDDLIFSMAFGVPTAPSETSKR